MNRKLIPTILAALALLPAATLAHSAQQMDVRQAIGTWINPRGTVKVQTGPCGPNLCGRVVWASADALADARDSGISQVVGLELLRDYHSVGRGHYEGSVYVPDMGRSFFSKMEQRDPNTIRISGCILGGLLCKSQDWHRS